MSVTVNGIEEPTPCCPSADAEAFEVNPGPVFALSGTDDRCPGLTVESIDWSVCIEGQEARCTKVVEGQVVASDSLPLVIAPEAGGLFVVFLCVALLFLFRALAEKGRRG